MDIKAMYQEQAEELAESLFHVEYQNLGESVRTTVYIAAVSLVNDKLASQAEARGDAMGGK